MTTSSSPHYVVTQPESQIQFHYTPNKATRSSLLLINVSSQIVLFRIRTNAPLSYLVNPFCGALQPSEVIDINIDLQPTEELVTGSPSTTKFQINIFPCPENIDASTLSDSKALQAATDTISKGLKQTIILSVDLVSEAENNYNSNQLEIESIPEKDTNSQENNSSGEAKDVPSRITNSENNSFDVSMNPIFGRGSRGKQKSEAEEELTKKVVRFMESNDSSLRVYEEKIISLERKIGELTADIKSLNGNNLDLTEKVAKQEKLIQDLTEERQKIRAELEVTKISHMKSKPKNKEEGLIPTFNIWHIILIALIGLVLGKIFIMYEQGDTECLDKIIDIIPGEVTSQISP